MKSLQSVPAIKGDVPGRRGPRARLARAVRRVARAVAGRVGRWAGLATLGAALLLPACTILPKAEPLDVYLLPASADDQVLERLHRLRDEGVGLTLDAFGRQPLELSMITRIGTAPNHSKARRWQPSQVATVWSQTNSTYWWREKASVITNAQVRRMTPSASTSIGPAPKSTWAAWAGSKCRRTVVAAGCLARRSAIMRRTAE